MTTLDSYLPAIRRRDPDAFANWMAGAEHRIRASLSSFARQVDTESILQECLLRVWQTARGFEPDGNPDSLVRYAIRIARNLALTEVRRRQPDQIQDDMLNEQSPNPATDDPLFLEELRVAVRQCIESLPDRPRRALEARLNGRVQRDAILANNTGMKLNTFLQNIRRARQGLASCLEKRGIELGFEP